MKRFWRLVVTVQDETEEGEKNLTRQEVEGLIVRGGTGEAGVIVVIDSIECLGTEKP